MNKDDLNKTVLKVIVFSWLLSSVKVFKNHSLFTVTFWYYEETKAIFWNKSKIALLGVIIICSLAGNGSWN